MHNIPTEIIVYMICNQSLELISFQCIIIRMCISHVEYYVLLVQRSHYKSYILNMRIYLSLIDKARLHQLS